MTRLPHSTFDTRQSKALIRHRSFCTPHSAFCIAPVAALLAAALTVNAQLAVGPLTQDNAPIADRGAAEIMEVKPSAPCKFKRVWTFAVARDEDFVRKTAADVERELNDLFDAGVDEICAFEMTAIIDDPELYAVFLKYCGE